MYCQRYKESGAVFVETALSMILFMFVMIGGLQLAILGFRYASLQHTANSTLRWISINHNSVTVAGVQQEAIDIASPMGLPIQNANTSICGFGEYNSSSADPSTRFCPVNEIKTYKQLIVVDISHTFPLIFGLWNPTINAVAIGRNEP